MIWNEEIECISEDELEKLQLKRLQEVVKRAYENVPYYKKRFDDEGIKPEDIKTLDDIQKLPLTTKDDLRAAYPFGMFAVPRQEIVEVHTSSGTTGKPTVSGYTRQDLEIWSEVMARGLTMFGLNEDDLIQNTHGYGLFTGGFGVHYGAQKIGATVIPISTGQTRRQIEIMKDFGTTVLIVTPSYGLYLAEVAEEEGLKQEDLNLKSIGFGAEMWTEEMRQELQKRFNAPAYNIYGLTEIMGPGVALECPEQDGLHVMEDHFYPEIIDSETMDVLEDGEKGELVITTLSRHGMPIIRFRTKDVTSLRRGKCACGRTHVKMERITGRTDDMLKIRGVAVFPSQIEKALLKMDGIEPHYQIIVTRPQHLDEMEVQVETSPKLFSDEVKELVGIKKKIENYIHNEIGLRVTVTLVEPKTLPRSEGKAVRVIDKRDMNN
ncbi:MULTISPECIES: phenylacetate--CoA ligase family protein [Methanobacterium]|uniref:Phenylacetate--CoA ligase n=1 Tax=Methanobacterium subterraneum TaxID=59277 RepID=A0A2H4VTM0_9EURY|nr:MULTISPECIES: phenylacetate--CoA ligase [Methanobacterium]MBW4257924.1 phenylacetate--CoA ligase [Methanobacterium sp. YSL]PKL72619.1 MAG: phenylacetate--CoA ligase [Methanobacteriales archaeon HGW-Methanobacteriales-2]AUB55937.1 phenylacetate--CoA ligase [Methanobacterium subterraneum]AUB59025.1 phenylacetate--CoA ligase [Methanobacterium sp. MZ-A1]AUB61455.1 phenylacetate--CoA ligase [Methanobacterium subterraneum]